MPRDTYFNLDEEKRERVYQAIAKEFTRVPLEDVLRYLVVQTRREGEPGIRNGIEGKKSDIFDFILFLFLGSLSANEREALMELLISSLKEAFVSLLTDQSKAEKNREPLEFKLEAIKAGIGIKG